MKVLTIILSTSFIFIFSFSAFAQEEEKYDSYENSYLKLQALYKESACTDKRFINGFLYAETFPGTLGHPFFMSETWYSSELSMEGRQYEGLALRYDLYRDQLLYNHIHPSGSYIVVLNKELTETFVIEGHRFKKLPCPASISTGIKDGYYELLSEGEASFYVKWQKRLSDPTPDSRGEFTLLKEWYVLNKGEFRKVSSKSGLLKALEDHKKEIKSFIHENRIVLKTGNELEIKRIINYYNRLEP